MLSVLTQLNAALAGRYELETQLGAGGMATVFLAHDLRHDRRVAVKVLHPDLAATLGPDRFLSEIKTTANLQHPHILPLFDSGAAGGFLFYVMPYLEGETLRSRLDREKQLALDDALRITKEVASALEYAHRRGVIHRDIKPENILLQDGRAFVMDFGIALALSSAGDGRITATGISLGTPQYMSPEQATGGQPITARADVFVLGCVVYEMLVGEPPFTGPTPQAIMARVLSSEPTSIVAQRATVPLAVDSAVQIALQKLPADRFRSVKEFADALEGRSSAVPKRVGVYKADAAKWLGWGAAGVLALWLLTDKVMSTRSEFATGETVRRLSILLPDSAPLTFVGDADLRVGRTSLALSPDGKTLVYVGRTATGTRLFRRPLNEDRVTAIQDTDSAFSPFFSPDGAWIAFFAGTSLRKVALAGGSAIPLAEVTTPYGGTWHHPNRILIAEHESRRLTWIPANGGTPLSVPIEQQHLKQSPTILPDGDWALAGRKLISLKSLEFSVLTPNGLTKDTTALNDAFVIGSVQPVGDSHLLWVNNARLHAISFDGSLRRTRGLPIALPDTVRQEVLTQNAQIAVAPNGTVVYAPGSHAGNTRLVLSDLEGRRDTLPFARAVYRNFALSPDGQTIAAIIASSGFELWLLPLRSREASRLIVSPHLLYDPIWRSDGRSLVFTEYSRGVGATADIKEINVGTGQSRMVVAGSGGARGLADDGESVVMGDRAGLQARSADGKTRLIHRDARGVLVEFSPDGRWVAWASVASGKYEIHVASTDDMSSSRRVTPNGCTEPHWMPDSQAIVCQGLDAYLYLVHLSMNGSEVRAEPSVRLPLPRILDTPGRTWDLSRDGKFVLYLAEPAADTTRLLTVITNLPEEIRRLAASR